MKNTKENYAVFEKEVNGKPLVGQINLDTENFADKSSFPYCLDITVLLKEDELNYHGLPSLPAISQTCYDVEDFLMNKANKFCNTYFVAHFFNDSKFRLFLYLNDQKELSLYLQSIAYQPKQIRNFSYNLIEDKDWGQINFLFRKKPTINNNPELESHFKRNAELWERWKHHGITKDKEFTILFHFYAAKKSQMETLCKRLQVENIKFNTEQTRTFVFLKGWKVDAKLTQIWTLTELQDKMGYMFMLSTQTDTSLEGCGAYL